MGCEQIREVLSAGLDGEAEPAEEAVAEAHLRGCAGCRRWLDDAAAVTRLARVGVALPARGVPETVLDAAPGGGRRRLVTLLRVLLGLLGGVQILVAVAQVTLPVMAGMDMTGHAEGATLDHLIHETAAWNLAVGAAFVFIAARRTRPAGVLPILTAFVVALTLLSLDDMLSGAVSWSRLASHTLLLAGYAILVALSRPAMRLDSPPSGNKRPRTPGWRLGSVQSNVVELPRGLHGRPTAHSEHRAA
jgi:predicted anti-sigma-YlaC factor YlaD